MKKLIDVVSEWPMNEVGNSTMVVNEVANSTTVVNEVGNLSSNSKSLFQVGMEILTWHMVNGQCVKSSR